MAQQAHAFRSLDSERFEQIRSQVLMQARSVNKHGTIAEDMTNKILLSMMQEPVREDEFNSWVQRRIHTLTDAYVGELWQYCFGYAFQLTSDTEAAQDITQSVIVAMLQTKNPISYIKGWLKSAVYNQSMLFMKKNSRESQLINQARIETGLHQEPAFDETRIHELIQDKDLKRLLSKAEYHEWKEMQSHKSLKGYAELAGISYANARKRKHIILTNLKAHYLREQGWVSKPVILEYNTCANIDRFLQTILEYSQSHKIEALKNYCDNDQKANLQASLSGFKEISGWTITILGADSYQICLVDESSVPEPLVAIIKIKLNRAQYIKVNSSSKASISFSIPEDKLGPLPMSKGQCTLTYEQIEAYAR